VPKVIPFKPTLYKLYC